MPTGAPLLYEVATRPWLNRLSDRHGRRITLGDVPDPEIAAIASAGFDFLWPMGVWRTGEAAARIAQRQPWLRRRWLEAFPGSPEAELVGSPFAVAEYAVDEELGGDTGLELLRRRLADAGLSLILDFVPHHTASDAPWIDEHADWYVAGGDAQRHSDPAGYFDRPIPGTHRWLAHCRDPFFPPWTDTAPLDYRNPAVRRVMTHVLSSIAERCDGIRADMAMLVLDDIFRRTWAGRSLPPDEDGANGEFWDVAIASVRRLHPGFVFIAEAYWGQEWRLQQLGFDYTYDKTFLDRLARGDGSGLAAHLRGDDAYQRRSVRFLENHDEERAAAQVPFDRHRAGAVLAATVPGMFLAHDGQLAGARFRSPVQFARHPVEQTDQAIGDFYARLFGALAESQLRHGVPLRLVPEPASAGNLTREPFVAHLWSGPLERLHLAVVNLGGTAGQCRLRIPVARLAGRPVRLVDLIGPANYERPGDELLDPGLYLDLPASAVHLFRIEAIGE